MEVDRIPPLDAIGPLMRQANAASAHPALFALLKSGLHPGSRRYRRNFNALYTFNCGASRSHPTRWICRAAPFVHTLPLRGSKTCAVPRSARAQQRDYGF